MKRKIEIPKMEEAELLKWSKIIKPVPLNMHQDDFSKLSVLADVKMILTTDYTQDYYPTFYYKCNIEEVVRQIPKELLEKVIAFDLVYQPRIPSEQNVFKKESKAGYYVSIIRLYQLNTSNNIEVPSSLWSAETSSLPIGMTKKEFQKLKEIQLRPKLFSITF